MQQIQRGWQECMEQGVSQRVANGVMSAPGPGLAAFKCCYNDSMNVMSPT